MRHSLGSPLNPRSDSALVMMINVHRGNRFRARHEWTVLYSLPVIRMTGFTPPSASMVVLTDVSVLMCP